MLKVDESIEAEEEEDEAEEEEEDTDEMAEEEEEAGQVNDRGASTGDGLACMLLYASAMTSRFQRYARFR